MLFWFVQHTRLSGAAERLEMGMTPVSKEVQAEWDEKHRLARKLNPSLREKDEICIHKSPSLLLIMTSLLETGTDRFEIPLVFKTTVSVYYHKIASIGYQRKLRFHPDSLERVAPRGYGEAGGKKTWKICGYIHGDSDILDLLFTDSPCRPLHARFVATIDDEGHGYLKVIQRQ